MEYLWLFNKIINEHFLKIQVHVFETQRQVLKTLKPVLKTLIQNSSDM